MMSHKFIKDPRELVKAGDVLKVKVLEVDLQRRRIALTMKLDAPPARGPAEPDRPGQGDRTRDADRSNPNRAPHDRHGGSNRPQQSYGSGQGGRSQQGGRPQQGYGQGGNRGGSREPSRPREPDANGAMAEAWAQALKGR
jgi:uncharacterized protein